MRPGSTRVVLGSASDGMNPRRPIECRMCGIVGVAVTRGNKPSVDARELARLRDLMIHRGPDDAGSWDGGNVLLGHRRLAVLDLSSAGRQPMLTPDGAHVIVYNGELYNDAELREALRHEGAAFTSTCDAETVLWALAVWGRRAITRFRGMFALAWMDVERHTLTLARDPLGIKPLYYWKGHVAGREELVFASEIRAILSHPSVAARPDFPVVSAYLTTIRTTLGERTLFVDVRSVQPGEAVECDLSRESGGISLRRDQFSWRPNARAAPPDARPAHARIRDRVEDSVRTHLRSDASLCCMLSGGLDSSIIAAVASRRVKRLHTYWAGAACATDSGDRAMADLISQRLGTSHTRIELHAHDFLDEWRDMIVQSWVPLSTPNEAAIRAVCRAMRQNGHVVTLSGEGADELFGGYAHPLRAAMMFESQLSARRLRDDEALTHRARFQIDAQAWSPLAAKRGIMAEDVLRTIEGDAALIAQYEAEFAAARDAGINDDPLQAHLRFQRRINLTGLLLRLDSASMLESIEGRTPFADEVIRDLAESLPMRDKFGAADGATTGTKIALRRAFEDVLPDVILHRPKESFPIPFQTWMGPAGSWLASPSPAVEWLTPDAVRLIALAPGERWHLAWPMLNIAAWASAVWG